MEKTLSPLAENAGRESMSIPSSQVKIAQNAEGGHTLIITFSHADGLGFLEQLEHVVDSEALRTATRACFQRNKTFMCLHLMTTGKEPNVITVRAHGFFLDKSLEKFHGFLKLRLNLAVFQNRPNEQLAYSFLFNQDMDIIPPLTGLEAVEKTIESCIGKEPFTEKKFSHVTYWLTKMLCKGPTGLALNASVKVVFFYSDVTGLATTKVRRDLLSDFVIVASNGKELPCHKAFLGAQSDVLLAMIESGMKESTSNKMEMEDISEESVTAFLDFLYNRNVSRATESCEIAFDLLELGHKYKIPDLESLMKKVLLSKPTGLFDVVVALRLFLFVRNLEGYKDVMLKTCQVMKLKSKEMLDSQECLRLFNGNYAALELCFYLSQN